MAEDNGDKSSFAPEIGDPTDGETDILFRAQMGAFNFFAGSWRQLLGVLGVLLLVVLGYSLNLDRVRDNQRTTQAGIADIDRKMPKPDPMAALLGSAGDAADPDMVANVQEGARRYEAVATEATGAGATMAWMRSADAWSRSGDADKAAVALQAAHDIGSPGVLGWSAASQLAAARAGSGDIDGAAVVYLSFTDGDDFIAEHASLELGLLYESAGRTDEASTMLSGLIERFPESMLASQASEALSRLRG